MENRKRPARASMIIPDATLTHGEEAEAVNFREIRVGNIGSNTLYRSSHPIKDNKQERTIALLAANARIATVLNLTDTDSGLNSKAFVAPWYSKLHKDNRIIALGMDFNFDSENFNKKLKKCLQFIIATSGPWLIHCHAGVDRTGFVAMVLEVFMGATLDEITRDYLSSFNSIFDSYIYNSADSLVVIKLLSVMSNSLEIKDENLQTIAENYLLRTIKLSREEAELLKAKLAKPDRPA
jgi:protein tyrosine/serine phosphatase